MNNESFPEICLVEKKINESQKRDAILNYYGPFIVTCKLNM